MDGFLHYKNLKKGGREALATKLKDLKVTKVDFVDAGANPKAHIMLYKSKSGDPEEKPEEEPRREGALKRFFTAIGKAVGMKPEEIDAAAEEIEKGGAETFGEKLTERKMRQINDEIWDICFALQSSLCSILSDEEVENKQEMMQESLTQFDTAMAQAIGQWASGNTTIVTKKSPETVSEEEVRFMRYSKERIEDLIVKSETGEGREPINAGNGSTIINEPKGEVEKMIDKSLLTPAELAFFEDIEKRCSIEPGPGAEENADAGVEKKATGTNPEEEEEETEKGVAGCGNGKKPGVKKSALEEDIYAGLNPYVAAELERLKKRADEADEKELAEVAKKYEIIGKKPEDLVPVLKSLRNAGGTAYQDMISILDASVEAVNKSSMFTEIGKSGGYWNPSPIAKRESEGRVEVIAKSYMEKDPTLSYDMAVAKAWENNPDLLAEYDREAGF